MRDYRQRPRRRAKKANRSRAALSGSGRSDTARTSIASLNREYGSGSASVRNKRNRPAAVRINIPKEKSRKRTIKDTAEKDLDFYSFVQILVQSVTAAFLLLTFFFNISVVVGSSMNPTLENGDRILVTHCDYSLQYGDIIAVWASNLRNSDTGEMGEMIVKRVIGLPGDVISIDDNGKVYRNGEALQEDYINHFDYYTNKGNASFPLTVDENCVFVLGDNRNHSTDSRFVYDEDSDMYVGCIDQRYIMGKAVFCFYPFERMGALE